ncbi:MAG TPA: glycosyltransferase family 39 protein [Vicinamibacterales bacterium]
MRSDTRNLLICCGLVLLTVAAAGPVLEMGLIDDFSYTYTARELAATGRLRYYGTGPMLGAQVWFAALVIRLFGFSFTAVRLTTAFFAVGCAILIYRIGRTVGLKPAFACLATLTVVLSPLFVPLAVSFMTDVPALFFLLLCFFCGSRALASSDTLGCAAWLTAAGISGVAGGTVRQVIWGAPLSVIPMIGWIRRADKRIAVSAGLLFIASAAAVAGCLIWLSRQPYLEGNRLPNGIGEVLAIFRNVQTFASLIRTGLLFLLPVLMVFFAGWWKRWPSGIAWICAGVAAVLGIVPLVFGDRNFPFGDIVTVTGILQEGVDAIGTKVVILAPRTLAFLSFMTLAASAAGIVALAHGRSKGDAEVDRSRAVQMLLMSAPFHLGYLFILLYRAHFARTFDRYLLPLLPAAALMLLWLYQQRIRDRVPLIGWLAAAAFGLYGVATTHDYLAAARARLAAASALTSAGVPRTSITAGLEYDGWTQIESGGYLNSPFIRFPANAYMRRADDSYPPGLWYDLWPFTPTITPEYFVVYSRQPMLVDTEYPPITYRAWLPFSIRSVYLQRRLTARD